LSEDGFMPVTDWSARLTRPVRLKDDTVLLTLSDARDCLLQNFSTVTRNDALAHAVVLLMKAAEKKTRKDRAAATDQVALVLRGRGLR
jgi:hypothetical protein